VTGETETSSFWEGVRADYARLQDNIDEWSDYPGGLAEWDSAVGDGLTDR
jgi:hypothetical protein